MTDSQLTAPNLSIQADGITYAYRRFGNTNTDATPLLFLQHFRGNLDNWDPALVDPIAEQREVILIDYAGTGASTSLPRTDVTENANDVLSFLAALGLEKIDILGFSLGGYVAQEIALTKAESVRRIVLAGTAPKGGEDIHGFSAEVHPVATNPVGSAEGLLFLFFTRSEASVTKGWEFVQRIFTRQDDRDDEVGVETITAQLVAFTKWGTPDPAQLERLARITHPVLAANGDNDIMIPTKNTHLLGKHLPNAKVTIYDDAGHGFLFQYAADFAAEVNDFLS
jgi:pimeloyl-ACP methyl ester carboxylesterase